MSIDTETDPVFACRVDRRHELARVDLVGEVDAECRHRLRPALEELAADLEVRDLEVHLGEVTFLDSQGLHLLMELQVGMRAHGGRMVLVDVPPTVRRLLQIAGLADHFDERIRL